MFNQDIYLRAINFAAHFHADQKTPKGLPYLTHLSSVAMEVIWACTESSLKDEDTDISVSCAFLHDILEDTSCTIDDIFKEFTEEIALGVEALSKDKSLSSKKEQMQDSLNKLLAQPYPVQMVKLADRITNLQKPPSSWTKEKATLYLKESKLIFSCLKNSNIYLAKRLEEKMLKYEEYL